MRVLFATGSPAHYMAPPQLGDEQVVCGPDWKDERAPNGRWLSLHTPAGSYDLSAVAAKLPPEQQPDVVVCLVDASWRNTPCGLAKFSCPRVLLVADTHHLQQPLTQMIRYAASEPFTRVVLLYDRHHADVFRAAGVKNLFWFPGLTFPHSDAIVRQSRQTSRAAQIAFVGQVGKHHPRRARLAEALTARKLPLRVQPLQQAAAMNFYGASLLGFNASLNGDLNLRVFEILASGAALLTDALAPTSGLATLLGDGREMITYRSPEELAERAAHALARRAETQAIGAAGAKWFDTRFNELRRRDAFRALAFDGVTLPEFALEQGRVSRVWFGGDKLRLNQAVGVYEMMQELHRAQENVTIACDASVPSDVVELYETLPRMKVVRTATAADLAICSRTQASGEFSKHAARVWCWDAGASELPVLAKHLQASGLTLQAGAHALFARDGAAPISSAAEDVPELLKRAAERLAQEDFTATASFAERAVKLDNKNVTAYGLLGRGFRGMQLFDGATVAFKLASHLEPKNAEWKCELGLTLRDAGKLEEAIAMFQAAVRLDARHGASWFALGQSLFTAKRFDAAAEAFQRAHAVAPTDPQPLLWRGHALKRQGRLLEALQLHQRAVGGSGDVSAPPPGARRRVMFVVQHGPFWPSMASVYRAFAADPSWEVTVVALPYNHPYYVKEEERDAVFAFLKKEGIPYVHWSEVRLQPGCADVVFLQNPYDVSRPEGWRTHEIMRSVPRIAYIPYALEIHGGTENATMHVNLTLQQLAWAVFARSRRHRATFTELCETGDAHVAVTGHPKMDSVRDLASVRDEELERFIAGRKMVFWNPQFDVRLDGSAFGKGYSTFLRWQEFLPAEFARRQDLAFVIRPHPLFFATLEQRKILTAEQIAAFLERCAAAGNILVDRRPSYLPVFAAASALITDASSFLLEYAATGRPLLYLHNPNGPGLNADGAFVHEHCATATTPAEIVEFLDDVARGHDPKAETRRAAVKDYMHLPPEGVATAIKRTIEERLTAEFSALRQRRGGRLAEGSSGFLMNHSAPSSGLAEQSTVRKRSALVLGGAGHGNLGDEALLLSAVQHASTAMPEYQIVVATPDETVTQKTLGDIPAMLVPAPRRCLFRIDQDDAYWKAGDVFGERWTQLRTFLLEGSQAETLARLRAGRGPSFVDLAEGLRLLSAIADADVVVLHGGGILTSATRSRLWDCALIATLCEHWEKKLLLRSHQIGPIEGDEDTQRLREILGASVKVTTRDRNSSDVARAIGPTTLSIAERPDDAFFAKIPVRDAARSLRAYGLEHASYIGVCYRMHSGVGVRDAFMDEFADVCRKAAETFDLPLVLVPMMPGDVAPLHALCERLRGDATVIEGGESVWERVMLLQNARLVVSLPHHPLIFALRGGVPVISPVDGAYYRYKNVGSMGLFGCEDDVIMHTGDNALFRAIVRERLLWLRTNEAEVRRRLAAIGQQLDKEHLAAEAWFWTEGISTISPTRPVDPSPPLKEAVRSQSGTVQSFRANAA